MRLPVPGPRDVMSALERGSEQVEALLGAVPRALALLDRAEVLLERASAAVDRVDAVVDAATAEVARVGAVVDAATTQIDRVGAVVDAAATEIERVDTVVGGVAVQAGRVGALLDALEPSLTTLQPTLQTLADTTHPDEVRALVQLVDHLPELTERVEGDVLPVLATLGSVAPDVHDLLTVARELNDMLAKIPGMGRIKRRIDEEEGEDRTDASTR
ncbi:MAG TPA: hypothetical protein VFR45_02500 [Nocardioides sp.]|nr:hypothetical protein [Nocardioides sp.]